MGMKDPKNKRGRGHRKGWEIWKGNKEREKEIHKNRQKKCPHDRRKKSGKFDKDENKYTIK